VVVVGRGLATGVVEVRDRLTGDRREVPVPDAAAAVVTVREEAKTSTAVRGG